MVYFAYLYIKIRFIYLINLPVVYNVHTTAQYSSYINLLLLMLLLKNINHRFKCNGGLP